MIMTKKSELGFFYDYDKKARIRFLFDYDEEAKIKLICKMIKKTDGFDDEGGACFEKGYHL